MVRGEFESVVREEFLDRDASTLKPLVRSFHEVSKGLGSLVRKYFGISKSRSIVNDPCPVFLFLRILSFDILLLVHIDMGQLSRHFLLVAHYLAFSVEFLQKLPFILRIILESMSKIGSRGTLVDSKVSVISATDYFSDRITMYSVVLS